MGISLSGIGASGLDWKNIIDQLNQAEVQQKITPLTTQKQKQQDRLSAWQSLGSQLSTLKSALDNLKDPSDFEVYTPTLSSSSATVSANSLLTATAGTDAGKGTYDIVVNNLARGDRLESGDPAFTSLTTAGVVTGQLTINGKSTGALDSMNLTEVKNAINNLNKDGSTGVTASILQTGGGTSPAYKLLLSSDKTGKTEGAVDLTGSASNISFTTKQAATDASLSINGTQVTRSTNTFSDLIPGVTLSLVKGDPATTVTVSVDKDNSSIEKKILSFVGAYNNVLGAISQQSSYNKTTKTTGGPLFGDPTMKNIKATIQNAVLGARSDNADPTKALALSALGITFGSDNKLSFDTAKFESKLQSDPSEVVSLFNKFASSLSDSLDKYTDSIDGTLTLQQKSLQSSMDGLDKKTASIQDRINREMAGLSSRFLAMDTAVGNMQSQYSYVSAQLLGH